MAKKKATPLMTQYEEIKAQHPGALLLFRVGDFYETFGEDAVRSADILGITLTKRSNGAASDVELAGFPHHALDTYLPRLVRAGQRVAICEQLEEPRPGKKVVKRGVTELVTPGAHLRENILERGQNNYLASWLDVGGKEGIAFVDVSTGETFVTHPEWDDIEKVLSGFDPTEVLVPKGQVAAFREAYGQEYYVSSLADWACHPSHAVSQLKKHFKVETIKGFGLRDEDVSAAATGMILHYLKENGHERLGHIQHIQVLHQNESLWLDEFTLRNLEVLESNNPDGSSLLDVIDRTVTAMGKRTLRRWLGAPSRRMDVIQQRLSAVEELSKDHNECLRLMHALTGMPDLERSIARLSAQRINPRELHFLSLAMHNAEANFKKSEMRSVLRSWAFPKSAVQLVNDMLIDEPAVHIGKGQIIKAGVDKELDAWRNTLHNGQQELQRLLEQESERTGISSLKIGHNQVFGYHLEVRNTHKDKVPPEWIRKQTLVSAERYVTEELKAFEERLEQAESKVAELELKCYEKLLQSLGVHITALQDAARFIGGLDVFLSYALQAIECQYVKPEFSNENEIRLEAARHPVIESLLPPEKDYIENDISLDKEERQIHMITGPNMSGKSALLRQVALINLMAQSGSFVPAAYACIPILDKLFVRVGASDNISKGESTFMVEMTESASILNNLSGNCLVLLDEIGRGTSTYDGVSIAWAMTSYLHEHPSRPLTLFATHYHELNEMQADYPRIMNMNVSVEERGDEVVFLRKLQAGGSAHSFGIHVARMAGMPQYVVAKAEEMLHHFESQKGASSVSAEKANEEKDGWQLSFLQMDDPLLHEVKQLIKDLNVDELKPVEALIFLNDLKKRLKN